jgi:EAL domain-containing protein (putative c-di-GMP-specific phosphodiesterase class I)
VNILKIDGQFIHDIETNPINLAMVKSIHEIGCLMGKKTVAEFVENTAILNLLKELGVHYAQGYGVGYPMPLDQILALT